ncbi:TPA: glycosyl hydrolase family 28-related protein [Bacillus pacificus]
MANISDFLKKIKSAVYGIEVRGSIHDGIDAINKETEVATRLSNETKQKQEHLEIRWDTVISGTTSGAEVIDIRVDTNGFVHTNAKSRVDSDYEKNATQIEILKKSMVDVTTLLVTNPPAPLVAAQGDGTTDDTTAIQNIINYASTNRIKRIVFPSNSFLVNTLSLPATELHLVGFNTTLKGVSSNDTIIFNQLNRVFTEIDGFEFTNCKRGIQFILPTNVSTSYDYFIHNCSFNSIDGPDKYGIYLDGCREGIIKDCYSHMSSFLYHTRCVNPQLETCTIKSGTYGINGDGDDTPFSTGIRAQNITMLGCTYGVIAKGSDDGTLIGCMIDYCENPLIFDGQDNFKVSDSYLSTNGINNNPVVRIQNTINSIPRGIKIHHSNIVQRGKAQNVCIDIIQGIKDSEISNNYINFYQEAGISYNPSLTDNLKILYNEFSGVGNFSRSCLKANGNGNTTNRFIGNLCNDEMFNVYHAIIAKDNRIPNSAFKCLELSGNITLSAGSTSVTINFSRPFYSTPHLVTLSGSNLNLKYKSLTPTSMIITADTAPVIDTVIYFYIKHMYAASN